MTSFLHLETVGNPGTGTPVVAMHPYFPFETPCSDVVRIRGAQFPAGDARAYREGVEAHLREENGPVIVLQERLFDETRKRLIDAGVWDFHILRTDGWLPSIEKEPITDRERIRSAYDEFARFLAGLWPGPDVRMAGGWLARAYDTPGFFDKRHYFGCLTNAGYQLHRRGFSPEFMEEIVFLN